MRKIEFHVLLAITLLMLSADYSLAKERPAELPNVVFILADDMSYDSVSAYNPRIGNMQTPSIDRLIGQGMSFTDAHSGSSVCTPTRYGILTGRYCWRTRLKSSVLWEWAAPLLDPERLTVAEMLQAQGYYTGMIGKWHLGMDWYDKDGKIANGDLLITDSFFKNEAAAKRTKAVEERIDLSRPVTGGPLDHGFHSYFGVEVPNFPPYAWIRDNQVQASTFVPKPESLFGHPGPMAPGWELDVILPGLAAEAADWIADSHRTQRQIPGNQRHQQIRRLRHRDRLGGWARYGGFGEGRGRGQYPPHLYDGQWDRQQSKLQAARIPGSGFALPLQRS
jgi:hypothetical protein